ncbi:uncharacterized protein METZ01_LOCUS506399, partial [marine metagenome]
MFKRTILLLSVIFTGSLLIAIAVKSNNQMISTEEVQKMNKLRNKVIQSKIIEGQSTLNKVEKNLIKEFKQSLSHKNKLMEKIKLQNKVDAVRPVRLSTLGNAERDCSDCEFDFTNYGSECCDSAWDEYGINCADLEGNYYWDCSGCACPGDAPGECGDGACNSNEDCETCEADCGVCGECD